MTGLMVGNPLLVLIAVFIYFGASQENAATMMRAALHDCSVQRVMITNFVSLPAEASVSDGVDALLAGSQHDFPVTSPSGALIGIATRNKIIGALAKHGSQPTPITAIVTPCTEILHPDASTIDAIEMLQSSASTMIPVVDRKTEKVVGLVTAENVGEMMMVMTALRQHDGPTPSRSQALSASHKIEVSMAISPTGNTLPLTSDRHLQPD